MKFSAGMALAAVVVVCVAALEYWQYRDAQAYREAVNTQLLQLTQRLERSERQLDAAVAQLEKMEASSLGGLLDNANEALIHGWSAMIDAVEKELEKARETFDKKDPQTQAKPANPDDGEGPL